jgi:hypothetical protein
MPFVRAKSGTMRIKPPGGDEFILAGEWTQVPTALCDEIRPHVNIEVQSEPEPDPEPAPRKRATRPADE